MAFWLLWDPRWTLVAGGAAVGYVTNWIALKVMFEPVVPFKGPPWAQGTLAKVCPSWAGFQGLFLTRQEAVSKDFSHFMASQVVTPDRLWEALLLGLFSLFLWK